MNTETTSLTLLAIDDEITIQQILQHYFKDSYSVITKSNGKEALIWMQGGHIPDVIIADIDMPEMNGYEFIDQVRCSGLLSNIPLIMLSGNDLSEPRIRCLEAGADDYMIKPFNPRELAARINRILFRTKKN